MNKMKKLKIGLPYRDARLFFFKFLKDQYPGVVPSGFETRKPSAKDVNAIVGQIAIEQPELLAELGDAFDIYSKEEVPGGLDRVSQFLNTAATLRQGKGVRQSAADAARTGGIRKDYSKLTAQDIAKATTDAIEKKQAEFDSGDDVSDEKLLLRTAVGSVISQLEKEDVSQEALDNVSDAIRKIDTVEQFEKFLNYIADFEEYSVIYQYLVDTMDVIETNLGDIQAQKEDEELSAEDAEYPAMRKNEQEENYDNTPLEELNTLTPDEFEMVQNYDNFNPDEWGFNKHENVYFRKREGGESYEDQESYNESYSSTARYMVSSGPAVIQESADRQSPQAVNRQLISNEKKRVQNLYAQQRRYMDGY